MIGSDFAWRQIAIAWRRHPTMALDVAGSAREWAAALDRMDRSGKLSRAETNQLLDTLLLQIDAERDAARRALEARIAREEGIVRGRGR